MTNYERVKQLLAEYFTSKGVYVNLEADLHITSLNENANPPNYLFNGTNNLQVISMDDVAKSGYKIVKGAMGKPVNTVDAFLADINNEWFFIEFKDCKITTTKKDNIEKKGMANFLMLLDIFSSIGDACRDVFDINEPMKFAREHITYILVCSQDDNPYTYDQIRMCDVIGERYTPDYLNKFKEYFFKDAYVYTEEYFEKRFVNKFAYE